MRVYFLVVLPVSTPSTRSVVMATRNVTLKLIVDKSSNQVVFAECDKDFVDILLSFLTLPLGTIISLTGKQSSIGCMDNLYMSLENLSNNYLLSEACRTMLLQPISLAAEKRNKLAINIDPNQTLDYYACKPSCEYKYLCFYPNATCHCGLSMSRKVQAMTPGTANDKGSGKGVFVKKIMSFMIDDALVVAPSSTSFALAGLRRKAIDDSGMLEEKAIDVTPDDVLRLLKRSFLSETVLTDVFLTAQSEINSRKICKLIYDASPPIRATEQYLKKIEVKLYLSQSGKKVLYAEARHDFVDLLLSFLTFPTGSIVKQLGGHSHLQFFDNLYKSIETLSSADCFIDQECRELLLSPKLYPELSIENPLIRVEERQHDRYYVCWRRDDCSANSFSNIPNVTCGSCYTVRDCVMYIRALGFLERKGYVREATYMITDDLRITPLSSVALLPILKKAGEVMEEMVIHVGTEEALELLHSCLASKTALTNAFVGKKDQAKSTRAP